MRKLVRIAIVALCQMLLCAFAEMLREMGERVTKHTPAGESRAWAEN